MLFSHREGLKPLQKVLQVKSIDAELRNGLWSGVHEIVFSPYVGRHDLLKGTALQGLFGTYWLSLFKLPTDDLPFLISSAIDKIRQHFFSCNWNEVYDFIEFTLSNAPPLSKDQFRQFCNAILERENAGYRFVGDQILPISSMEEIAGIEEALSSPVRGAQAHLRAALGYLANRKSPDYRNSIKESISAVEAVCRAVTNDPKATLGAALKVLHPQVDMHPSLKNAFSSLYGYTNDEQGIRHAMLDDPNLSFSDAKLMALVCSAFVTFVVGKAAEKSIKLS